MHLITFRKSTKLVKRYSMFLKLLIGKKKGVIVRNGIPTKLFIKQTTLSKKRNDTIPTTQLYAKRKRRYKKTKYRLKLRYSKSSLKFSYLKYRFRSTPLPINSLFHRIFKHTQVTPQSNTNYEAWKMHSMDKIAQQSRTLGIYNATNASSSFFNKNSFKLDKYSYTIPLFILNHLSSSRDLPAWWSHTTVNSSPLKCLPFSIQSAVATSHLSQIVNKNNTFLKKLYTIETANSAQGFYKPKPSLFVDTNLFHTPHTNLGSDFLRQWLYETAFVHRKHTLSKSAILVLSRVPSYKMDSFSPVNADRYRGNVHTKLGLVHEDSNYPIFKEEVPTLHLSYRSSFTTIIAQNVKAARKINPTMKKKLLID
jgi:hypothetical protein